MNNSSIEINFINHAISNNLSLLKIVNENGVEELINDIRILKHE